MLVVAIVLAVLVPSGLYVALSMPRVQKWVRNVTERELTGLLGMRVGIGDINVAPFSRVALRRVAVTDEKGDTAITAERIGAGLNLGALVLKRLLVVNYTEVIGLDVRLHRDSASAPLNIQAMIDALSPKDKNKPPTHFDFSINTVVIRTSSASYDVGNVAETPGRFNPGHIAIRDFRADLRLPKMADKDFNVELRRMAFVERSGFRVESVDGEFHVGDDGATATGVTLRLPWSVIELSPVSLEYSSLAAIGRVMKEGSARGGIQSGSFVTLSDFSAFVPALADVSAGFNIGLDASMSRGVMTVENLDVTSENGNMWLRGDAHLSGLGSGRDALAVRLPRLSVGTTGRDLAEILPSLTGKPLSGNLTAVLSNAGHIDMLGEGEGSMQSAHASVSILTECGEIEAAGNLLERRKGEYLVRGELRLPDFDGAMLTRGLTGAAARLGSVALTASIDGTLAPRHNVATAGLTLDRIVYNGQEYADVKARLSADGSYYGATIESTNPGLDFRAEAEGRDHGREKELVGDIMVSELDLNRLGMARTGVVSASARFDFGGSSIDDINGTAEIRGLTVAGSGTPLHLDEVALSAECDSTGRSISLRSDMADLTARGDFSMKSLVGGVRRMVAATVPSLVADKGSAVGDDQFEAEFTIKSTAALGDVVKLPIAVIYPVTGTARVDSRTGTAGIQVDAPYLQQKGKLLENTQLKVSLENDSTSGRARIYATTLYPTKRGDMTLSVDGYATDNRADTRVSWRQTNNSGMHGDIDLTADFARDEEAGNALSTLIHVNPSEIVLNDTVWEMSPSSVAIEGKRVSVDGFRIGRQGQYVSIDGVAGVDPSDSLTVRLRDINLDYVFETLGIEAAMFGGVATGDFHAAAALSPEPRLYTAGLDVSALTYNHSLMGDTRIKSHWEPQSRAVKIDAVIRQPNGRQSTVDGRIMPLADSLDFHFDADKIEVGFMLPFMSAFTSEVSGYASGKARLWGSFKYIDMVGDIYAEDVKLKLDFTNTSYIATDSVHLTPGHIALDNIRLRDIYGHTALLNGWLEHEYFKKPKFRFNITDAREMLVYDVKENPDTKWYGRIFGNGSATVSGEPGVVDIGVNMQTAENSTFTFVLSDAEQAYDYTFITFRDRDRERKDSIAAVNAPPAVVRELKERIARSDDGGEPSIYRMNIAVDVTPTAQVTLVMDPVGGDRIRAYGNGNLRMAYDSANEDLRMFGTYTLTRGSYNFTLQDIIIKDFTIRDGSSITFHGDPFAAQLDIAAVYSVNANLSDLDESFLQDKELNRTNVPVHALLLVTGDMRQPDISFDLEFPTLTQDTYRKVRSIVSTEDMMNRQIIYLLALSRFYTPDYMTTTKGNELVSVASSTISSQLSSILGQLSDNWSIAPNFRSDRGDFSDVEVDLALSSHLLNNRLMLNGNFGYRDKSLNNNSFIGDFDIEYLLNRSGSVRLKAYNRYNDRNYYVRSALTTQGVGVVFKRDFDSIFSFLRRKKHDAGDEKKAGTVETMPADTVAADSTTVVVAPQL